MDVNNSIGISKVVYGDEVQSTIFIPIVEQILSEKVDAPSKFWINILCNLTHYSPIFKNHTFYIEKEIRIIYYYAESHNNQYHDTFLTCSKLNKDDPQFHFELSWFNSSDDHAISKIFIGPRCDLSPIDIKNIFIKNDITIKDYQIFNSSSTYI